MGNKHHPAAFRGINATQIGENPPYQLSVGSGSSIDDRMKAVWTAVTLSIVDPVTRVMAMETVRDCKGRDDLCELSHVYAGLKELIKYRGEPPGMDLFQTARRSIELGGGDCDCMTIAAVSFLTELGFDCGARVIDQTGEGWDHIYALVKVPRLGSSAAGLQAGLNQLALDISEPSFRLGDEVSAMHRVRSQDYWYDSHGWILWKKRGLSLSQAPALR